MPAGSARASPHLTVQPHRMRRAALPIVALAALSALPGCARSELDICIDHLQNITNPRQPRDVVEARCVDAIRENGGKSPF